LARQELLQRCEVVSLEHSAVHHTCDQHVDHTIPCEMEYLHKLVFGDYASTGNECKIIRWYCWFTFHRGLSKEQLVIDMIAVD